MSGKSVKAQPLLVLAALVAATSPDLGAWKGKIRERFAADPMGSVVTTVLGAAWIFYKAEKGHNPKVKSYYDALVYVSTNLSVGYSDIFAKTPIGKALGSALMTWGPALAAKTFDAPASGPAPVTEEPALREVVQKLDAILNELRRRAA